MQSLRGIFPRPSAPPKRDFIRENVRNLKLLQQQKKPNVAQSNETIPQRSQRPQRKTRSTSHSRNVIRPNAVKNIVTSKSAENVTEVDFARKPRPLSVQSRDAYSQTETVDDELFLKDVIIRLPSASLYNNNNGNDDKSEPEKCDEDGEAQVELDCSLTELENADDTRQKSGQMQASDSAPKSNRVIYETERTYRSRSMSTIHRSFEPQQTHEIGEAISTRCQQSLQLCAKDTNKITLPSSYRIGELPKYLKEMKIKEAEKAHLESLIDPNCPPGHSLLCEVDRLASLGIAKKKYQDLINELNCLPMTSGTLRVRNRKIEIERELNRLDDTIQIFSRPKVYVKDDE